MIIVTAETDKVSHIKLCSYVVVVVVVVGIFGGHTSDS
jgi:hypothetical protein